MKMFSISVALNMFAYWSYLKIYSISVLVAENLAFLFLILINFFTDNIVYG